MVQLNAVTKRLVMKRYCNMYNHDKSTITPGTELKQVSPFIAATVELLGAYDTYLTHKWWGVHCKSLKSCCMLWHHYDHTKDMLWKKFQWILPIYMKPIILLSKASAVCSVTTAVYIDFCLNRLNMFSQHIGKKKPNVYLNSAEQITRNCYPRAAGRCPSVPRYS